MEQPEQSSNKENVVLRALVGDPNRHKPLVEHPPPTTAASQEATPASMYTLETRYRPIPPKVLPKPMETTLYNNPQKREQPMAPSPPLQREEPEIPVLAEPEAPKHMEEEQESPPIVFLEPKIISQPILYSIVGAKTIPIHNDQSIPRNIAMPSPILYTITGQPQRPTTNIRANTLNVAKIFFDKSPTFYSLIGSPRLQVRFLETVKEVPEIPQQASSSLYSVVGNPHLQPQIQESVKQIPQVSIQPSPILYSIMGSPHLQPQVQESVKQTSQVPTRSSPILFSVVGSPHLQPQIQEPIKQTLQVTKQSSSTLYSIVGNPSLTPHIIQTNTLDSPPSTQPVNVSSVQPVPILYTIVGKVQVPKNMSLESRPPLPPIKRPANNIKTYTVIIDPNAPQSMPLPPKSQPLQPQKQQQENVQTPALYPLVGRPSSLPEEKTDAGLKPLERSKTPPSTIVPTRRISRSLDRQTAPEPSTETISSFPPIKNKRQAKSKELTSSKPETIVGPLPEHERAPRPKKLRATRRHISPGQINHKSFTIVQYDPLRPRDYISPYAYHPSKPYREETYNPTLFPILTSNRSGRKSRPPFYEPRYRDEQKDQYELWPPHSLERYPVNTKRSPRLWDYEYQAQTDGDDDNDDVSGSSSNRKKYKYRRIRPRTPWIPVW